MSSVPFSNDTTSLAAAKRAQRSANSQRQRVLDALRRYGALSDHSLAVMLGIGERQASTRRNTLVREGLVRDSGRRVMREDTGCAAILWEPVPGNPTPQPRAPRTARTEQVAEAAVGLTRALVAERIERVLQQWNTRGGSYDAFGELGKLVRELRGGA